MRADEAAVRALASDLGRRLDLAAVFSDVAEATGPLFRASQAGLWVLEEGRHLRLIAQRELDPRVARMVESLDPARGEAAEVEALRRESPIVLEHPSDAAACGPVAAAAYSVAGIRTACLVPVGVRNEPIGVLGLYHATPFRWSSGELALVQALADRTATALHGARSFLAVGTLDGQLRQIQDLTERLGRCHSIRQLTGEVVAQVGELVDCDAVHLHVAARDAWQVLASWPAGSKPAVRPTGPRGDGAPSGNGNGRHGADGTDELLTRAVASAAPVHSSLRVRNGRDGHRVAIALLPLRSEDRVRGVIEVTRAGDQPFGTAELATLQLYAGFASQAMLAADNLERLDRQQVELQHLLASQRKLLEVNERLLTTLDPGGVLDLIADSLKSLVWYDSLTVFQLQRDSNRFRAVVARDRFAELILRSTFSIDSGITGWVFRHGEAQRVNDAHLDPRSSVVPGTPNEAESMVLVPLFFDGTVSGTLNISRMGGPEAHFSTNEFELVKLFAGQASIALQNAQAHSAVSTQAETDAMTGLHNHGAFQRHLAAHLDSVDSRPIALLMLDLDGFKAFNDTHGHPTGDALLQAVAAALRSALRETDRAYRYGGDEFAVLLPGAELDEAREAAERVRVAVAGVTVEGELRVTTSIGVACSPEDAATKEELVASADRALYVAKLAGGDTVAAARRPADEAVDETELPEGGVAPGPQDAAGRRRVDRQAGRQSLRDTLTGLANRSLFSRHVRDALRRPHAFVVVMLLDLDRFSLVNDGLGHEAGDELLAAVAQRLREHVRPGDTVARMGGDEFAVLLPGVRDGIDALSASDRIAAGFEAPFLVAGHETYVTASIGIALGDGRAGPAELLRDANVALGQAKAAVGHVVVFEPGMRGDPVGRLDLESELRRALREEELLLYYQPIVELATGRVVGAEALARWPHPRMGLVLPHRFIPLAEETGLILPLGRWVLETACRQGRAWQEACPGPPDFVMSVNLSAREFSRPDLVEQVSQALSRSGLQPGMLNLEITESALIDSTGGGGDRVIDALRGLGVGIIVDDFGTGYASLAYLRELPVSGIKVDRSFVSGLGDGHVDLPIVRAITSLARGLHISATAEGIETTDQLAILRRLGCLQGQGYYFAKALPADEFDRLLGVRPGAPEGPSAA